MTKHQELINWLGNRQRKYADGLALFKDLASDALKNRYLSYFEQINSEVSAFDSHFTMLVNKLSDLKRNISQTPKLYSNAFAESVIPAKTLSDQENTQELSKRTELIESLKVEVSELASKLEDAENSGEGKEEEILQLKEELDAKNGTISALQEEIDALNKPGVKVVTATDLPIELQQSYARIQEIMPLYASLHNDIANESISDDERKTLAESLCKLDDERRKLWQKIDDWAEGKTVELEEKRPEFSDNKVVRGFEIARAIKRVKQNIATAKITITKAEKDGKENIKQNAEARLARYETELAELEQEIASEKISG